MKKPEIKRILIPMDFSETAELALEHGAFMASLFKAELYIIHIIEIYKYAYPIYDPLAMLPLNTDEMEKNVTKSIEEQAQKIKKNLA